MKQFLFIGAITLTINLYGQTTNDSTNSSTLILIAENEPQFPGGKEELIKFISGNLKYPKDARKKGVEGVVVSFVVERDGTIKAESIKVEQSIYPSLDGEAVRVVKLMPNWTPAHHKGRSVRAKTGIPMKFALDP